MDFKFCKCDIFLIISVIFLGVLSVCVLLFKVDKVETQIVNTTKVDKPQVLSVDNEETGTPIRINYIGNFKITAYCSCSKCCGKWGNNRPTDEAGNPIVYTASGALAEENKTVAVDPSVIPYGTILLIDGQEYIAQDTGSKVKGKVIDIYFENHEDAEAFGCEYQEIYSVEEAN